MKVIGEFFGHLAMGAVMFVALLVFGGSLNLLVHFVEPFFGDGLFITVVNFVEQAILFGDACFMLFWVGFSTLKAVKGLTRE